MGIETLYVRSYTERRLDDLLAQLDRIQAAIGQYHEQMERCYAYGLDDEGDEHLDDIAVLESEERQLLRELGED